MFNDEHAHETIKKGLSNTVLTLLAANALEQVCAQLLLIRHYDEGTHEKKGFPVFYNERSFYLVQHI